jgi:hypothetical protein
MSAQRTVKIFSENKLQGETGERHMTQPHLSRNVSLKKCWLRKKLIWQTLP